MKSLLIFLYIFNFLFGQNIIRWYNFNDNLNDSIGNISALFITPIKNLNNPNPYSTPIYLHSNDYKGSGNATVEIPKLVEDIEIMNGNIWIGLWEYLPGNGLNPLFIHCRKTYTSGFEIYRGATGKLHSCWDCYDEVINTHNSSCRGGQTILPIDSWFHIGIYINHGRKSIDVFLNNLYEFTINCSIMTEVVINNKAGNCSFSSFWEKNQDLNINQSRIIDNLRVINGSLTKNEVCTNLICGYNVNETFCNTNIINCSTNFIKINSTNFSTTLSTTSTSTMSTSSSLGDESFISSSTTIIVINDTTINTETYSIDNIIKNETFFNVTTNITNVVVIFKENLYLVNTYLILNDSIVIIDKDLNITFSTIFLDKNSKINISGCLNVTGSNLEYDNDVNNTNTNTKIVLLTYGCIEGKFKDIKVLNNNGKCYNVNYEQTQLSLIFIKCKTEENNIVVIIIIVSIIVIVIIVIVIVFLIPSIRKKIFPYNDIKNRNEKKKKVSLWG